MDDHILNFCGDSTLTQVGTFDLQPMCTTWNPHVPSDAFTNTLFIADSISLRCWGSPSFIKNNTRSLSHFQTSFGNASLNTHLKLNLCWLGMNTHIHTICLPIERREEKVRRWNPLLFEWEVTSTQTTSGHNLNNQNAGFTIQATTMNSASSFCRHRSDLSSLICAEREKISKLSLMGS